MPRFRVTSVQSVPSITIAGADKRRNTFVSVLTAAALRRVSASWVPPQDHNFESDRDDPNETTFEGGYALFWNLRKG